MANSFLRDRFFNDWKLKQLAFRDYARRENIRRYNRQRGFIINPYAFGAGAADPDFASVSLLLHLDGADGSQTVTDSSSFTHSCTMNGLNANIELRTAVAKYGTAGLFCEIPSASLANDITVPHHASLNLPGDHTIEGWVYYAASNTTNFNPVFVGKRGAATQFEYEYAYFNGDLYYGFSTDGTTTTFRTVSWTPSTGAWYFHRFTRGGSTGKFFVNSAQQGSDVTVSGTIHSDTRDLTLVTDSANAVIFQGQMDDWRITKGVERVDSIPPGAAFPDS